MGWQHWRRLNTQTEFIARSRSFEVMKKKYKPVTLFPKAIALTIAGSDPSGGAGLQADLKVFQQLGVYGMSVVTLITVQNTQGVERLELLDPQLVLDQLEAVLSDIPPKIIKVGALGNAANVEAIAKRLETLDLPVVIDPVMISKHGHSLIDDAAVELYRTKLLRNTYLITPNRFEAERLTGIQPDSEDSVAKAIYEIHLMGAKHVLLKLGEENGKSVHVFGDGSSNFRHSVSRLNTSNTHGTGCALSAAITARLARGENISCSVNNAIEDVWQAIHASLSLGKGHHHPIEFRLVGATN